MSYRSGVPRRPELLRGPASVPFVAALARHGDATAIVTQDESLTYAELAGRVEEDARRLGTERRLVVVAGANGIDPIVTYLAALSAGHPVLLATAEHVEPLAAAYDADVVVAPEDGAWRFEERRDGSAHDLHPELALLLSTSGSTGSPKLVRLSHENVQANAESIAEYLQIGPADRAATTLPMHYSYGLSVVNSHLQAGATLVLTDLSVVDGCFWDLVRREQATSFAGVPYTFELLDRVGFADMDLPHLRYVTQAGGRMAPDRVVRWATAGRERGWDLFVMYGATEATARMSYLPPDLTIAHPQTIGVAIPGGSFSLEPLPECDDHEAGELVYSGPNVMLGYAEAPAELALGPTVDVLRTGDVARRTPDGLYEIVGRRSRFVKVVGLRIDLGRAEQLLSAHGLPVWCAGVDDTLVIAFEDEGDAEELRRLAARQLGLPPRAVHAFRVPELPRLPSGKPDYRAIAALAPPVTDAPEAQPTRPPGHDVESLRMLFAELLERPEATRQDTFVSLGGDSLSYVEMSMRLEQALGSLPANWHVTPIEQLAEAADVDAGRRWGRAVEMSIPLRAIAILMVVGTHA
ncbi:MAG TPA: non-ribosomal peptide synthetase, partial [Conexibacter sp.]|nr:non-ribosomal peptide synthetase [Conexibacter sp.]